MLDDMRDPLLFQYCQKIIVFSRDFTSILLAKRRGEQDYDGVFSFIGGKLETTDGGILAGLKREKNEEIGSNAQLKICPTTSYNVYFTKKDGHHMILPHYIAIYTRGDIELNDEYSEYAWVQLANLEEFEPKIETIAPMVRWAQRNIGVIEPSEWVTI